MDLDATWQHWLGSIQSKEFSESRFVIVAQIEDTRLGENNHERIERLIHAFHCGLLLQGFAYCSGGLEVGGNTDVGLHLGPIGPVFPHVAIAHRHLHSPAEDQLREAYKIAKSIIKVFGYPRRFMRLRRSFRAWTRGIREGEITGDRLHNFVRTVEGLTQPPRRGLTSSFVIRSQLFIGHSLRNAALLRQLYNLRSCMEHVQLWRSDLKIVRGLDVKESFLFRALQAELVASSALLRIFGSAELLPHFGTEATIRRFWSLPDRDREKLWGKPLSLNREANRLYIRLY